MGDKSNIILPIKPEFAEKILCGQKKYEYRKQLCKKDIYKIYIYETRPVKMIVGEAEVVKKLNLNKAQLWEITNIAAGISKDFYDDYFKLQPNACAYEIANVKRFEKSISLESIGVKSIPQSFVYCNEISQYG